MSQDYFSGKGKAVRQPNADSGDEGPEHDTTSSCAPGRDSGAMPPAYMTVGTGSTSQHAARLQAMLDNDSGYGGSSIAGDEAFAGGNTWIPALDESDMSRSAGPSQGHPAGAEGSSSSSLDGRRLQQASAVHQLWYNAHRGTLARAIHRVVDTLRGLQEMNAVWPAHYPSVRRAESSVDDSSVPRPPMQHAYTSAGEFGGAPVGPGFLQRSRTAVEPGRAEAESSRAAEKRGALGTGPATEPRLVTPQIAQEFSVLKLDLKLGGLHQVELVHSLEKASIASLLDGRISSSIKHLLALRERIEDTSSKVLVTGDLNAGKSTFCNALLRRKILPEDQQPCTAIFCEVLDARENDAVEEVHAVHKDVVYHRHDETTYDVYKLSELEKVVTDNRKYAQCKVYVKDVRSIDESLLNNGVVDIALIDGPGLNSDTTKTTAVFARQEEIDVVVFVVSAANHFTISAKEFIWAAAAEKAYLFIVVNQFDTIRDKERCQKMILEQVQSLSPRTWKESSELVHFVSSDAIPMAPSPPGGPGGSGSGSSSGGGGDPGDDDPKGKGKEKEKIEDFQRLEQSLRRFVLEKRARSKLAPAKTYLSNILNDLHVLATVNTEVAQSELDRVTKELAEIEPELASSKKADAEAKEEVDRIIDKTCKEVYDDTRTTLSDAISHAGDGDLGVPYPGLLGAFQFAEDIKEAMLTQIAAAVTSCEERARAKTVGGVNVIKQLGILHLGDEFANINFHPEVMFKRRRDNRARHIDVQTELWDFFDISTLLHQQEKVAGTGMALTVATALGTRMIGGAGWMDHAFSAARIMGNDNLRRLILPGLVVAGKLPLEFSLETLIALTRVTLAITTAAYVLSQIPHSLPHRLSNKIATQLAAIDYVHANSERISSSVREVLRFPADNLRVGIHRSVEKLGKRREETLKTKMESETALKYFRNLVRDSEKQRDVIAAIDLDITPPGPMQVE